MYVPFSIQPGRSTQKLALIGAAAIASALLVQAQGLDVHFEPRFTGPPNPSGTNPITGIYAAPNDTDRLFLLTKEGKIWIRQGDDSQVLATPFLDISGIVSTDGERGLNGMAFPPGFDSTVGGDFFLLYSKLNGDSKLSRWSVSAGSNVAQANSEVTVLTIVQPASTPGFNGTWHNASQLQFGPDGYLYIGSGDGGGIGDPDNHAQDVSDPLGKILRIDVSPTAALPYGVPASNPFISLAGALPEVWAYGLRNPWRFSFDRITGDLYIADVGQFTTEEVNFQAASSGGGENYGWNVLEGTDCYDPSPGCGFTNPVSPPTDPVLTYPHSAGDCAIIGGFVYRGPRFPQLGGQYFYTDYCSGKIWASSNGPSGWSSSVLAGSQALSAAITTFGEDSDGELYFADGVSNVVFQLVGSPFCDLDTDQPSYSVGETVRASVARLANKTTAAITVKVRILVQIPGGPQVQVFPKASGSPPTFPDLILTLPAGYDDDLAPTLPDLFDVPSGTPPGTYELTCLVTDSADTQVITFDSVPFEIQ